MTLSRTETDADELGNVVQQLKLDLDLLIRSGQWLVWSAVTLKVGDDPQRMEWAFRTDFSQMLPDWFDVERLSTDRDLGDILSRVRLVEDNDDCHNRAYSALKEGKPGYSQVLRVRLRDARISWVEENVSILPLPGGQFHLVGVCIDANACMEAEECLKDMQEELLVQQLELLQQNEELHALRDKLEQEKNSLAEANVRLASLATIDGLTAIKNHRAFQEQLDAEWAAAVRQKQSLALILLDINAFKRYNDEFGHPAGDEVVKAVGVLLERASRSHDCVARYGGEEFVAILPHTDLNGAAMLAERIWESIEQHPWTHRRVTASMGVAACDSTRASAQQLIRRADRALYKAKVDGRNRVCRSEHRQQKVA